MSFKPISDSHDSLKLPGDSTTVNVPWRVFETLFRGSPVIRTAFDWDEAESLEVQLEILSEIPNHWYTVWYSSSDQGGLIPVNFDTPDATPLTIGEASQLDSRISVKRSDSILRIAQEFSQREKAALTLVAWRTPSGRTIILDGNHRAVSSLVAPNMNIRAEVFVVCGPANSQVVPDLGHHV